MQQTVFFVSYLFLFCFVSLFAFFFALCFSRHSIDDVDQFKSPHFHFHLNKPKLSKHAKAIREGKAINQARKSFQRMANGLRQRYNLKYSAVIGQIRARLRVRKRQEIKQESSQKTSNELKEHGSGIKFLLSRQVS